MIGRRVVLVGLFVLGLGGSAVAADPLPSWNESAAKQAIVAFVARVTHEGGTDFVTPADRIAAFDNDGTLWAEQPIYFQFAFAIDRIKAMAPQHPAWKTEQPFAALLSGDRKALAASGEKGLLKIVLAASTGMSTEAFAGIAKKWLATAQHPRFKRPYVDLAYQPMQELLAYLRANGFRIFIVSGGDVGFMRAFAEARYGVPPEQVIGSLFVTKYRLAANTPELVLEPKAFFVDDGPGKPEAIDHFIGRRPIFAFGDSDGDREMLEWTKAGNGPRFAGLVHHTDAEREWAYDRRSSIVDRQARQGARRSDGKRLDRRRYEARLEHRFRF